MSWLHWATSRGTRATLAQVGSTLAKCPDPGPVLHDLLAATTRRVGTDSPRPTAHDRTGQLSDRERDVLQLLATPLSQREIADELHLSLNTVTTHSRQIFRKLDVPTRAQQSPQPTSTALL